METGRLPGDVFNLENPLEKEFCYQAALLHIEANKPATK